MRYFWKLSRLFTAPLVTLYGVVAIAASFLLLPALIPRSPFAGDPAALEAAKVSIRGAGVQVALGIALTVSAFIALRNFKSARHHQMADALSKAAALMESRHESSRIAGVHLLAAAWQGAKPADAGVREGARAMLQLAEGDDTPNVSRHAKRAVAAIQRWDADERKRRGKPVTSARPAVAQP